jgi:hypothetical protein
MIATLQFSLPEEQEEHQMAVNAWRYRRALHEFDQYLRGIIKYGDEKAQKECTPEVARAKLWEILGENEVGELV